MNTRTALISLKERLIPVGAFTAAVALSLLLVWTGKRFGVFGTRVILNPDSQAAKVVANSYFEPPRYIGKGRAVVRPPVAALPSAQLRFERELEQRKSVALRNPAAAQVFLSQLEHCVSLASVPMNDQIRCMFAAHEVYKVRRGTPVVDIAFDRVNRVANPGVRQHVESYFEIQAKARK